jgi:hypothetical protein
MMVAGCATNATTLTPTYTPIAVMLRIIGYPNAWLMIDGTAVSILSIPKLWLYYAEYAFCGAALLMGYVSVLPYAVSLVAAAANNCWNIPLRPVVLVALTNATTLTPTYTPIAADAGNGLP